MANIINNKREFFKTGKTKDINFRIEMLKKLKKNIIKNEEEILEAIYKDLNRSKFSSYSSEVHSIISEIDYFIKNIKKFAKPKRKATPKVYMGYKSFVEKEAFGVVLIISPWNYPFLLALSPLIGAISAGNCAIIKPSEYSPNCSNVLKKLIEETFAEDFCEVILGESDVVQNIIEEKVDFIFFTGSTKVGKIIMEKAAKNLTPVALELGGKSPCIIDKNTDLNITAKRIVWGKTFNAGQTCIAPDYLLVDKEIKEEFLEKLIHYTKEFWGDDILKNSNYPKIINEKHFNNSLKFLEEANIIYGGKYDRDILKIEPTYIGNPSMEHILMQEEIFAPILPILTYEKLDEVFKIVGKNENPLALYIFSKDKNFIDIIKNTIPSGSVCINDTILQTSNHNICFEGVGNSGMNGYHGEDSFNLFSHTKGIMKAPFFMDIDLKYPNKESLEKFKKITKFLK